VDDVILVIDDLLAHKSGNFEWLLHYNELLKTTQNNIED